MDSPEASDLYDQDSHRRSNRVRGKGKIDNGGDALNDNQEKSASFDDTATEVEAAKTKKEPTLREGWETRILRHHDKIIRAKNNSNTTNMGKVRESTMGVIPLKPTLAAAPNAMPPPSLISALRQVFGSASSHNLQDLMDKMGETSDVPDGDSAGKMSTLPSLLYTISNHNVFVGSATELLPDQKKS